MPGLSTVPDAYPEHWAPLQPERFRPATAESEREVRPGRRSVEQDLNSIVVRVYDD